MTDCIEHARGGPVCAAAGCRRKSLREMLESVGDNIADDARQRMKRLKNNSGLLRQIVDNLYGEIHLACEFWRGFITTLNSATADVEALCHAIRQYARSALFQGPAAHVPVGATMGHATSRKDLVKHLLRSGYVPDKVTAGLAVDDAMALPIEDTRKKWAPYELGRYVMWATFDPAGGRPFAIAGITARLLRGRLGLPGRRSRHSVLTLEYDLPADVQPRLPTIAEACAGKPWLVFFRPSGQEEADDGYSLTQPHDQLAHKHAGMPEVVHAPVTGAMLAYPPAEID